MGESEGRDNRKAAQGTLLPPHLRDPAEAASAPALPCIKAEGVCSLRTKPGASFHCIFSGRGCSYLTKAGDKPAASALRSPGSVPLATTPHPETGESPRWYLPDGRPVYRDALVKRWEALGRPAIVLNRTVTVVDLPKWLAQDDVPIPPRVKWGTWRLDLLELARVVDFLTATPPEAKAVEGGAH